jgi:hypothetical protein
MKNFVTFRRAITPVHSAKMTPKKEVITPKMTKKMIMSQIRQINSAFENDLSD